MPLLDVVGTAPHQDLGLEVPCGLANSDPQAAPVAIRVAAAVQRAVVSGAVLLPLVYDVGTDIVHGRGHDGTESVPVKLWVLGEELQDPCWAALVIEVA